MTRLRIVSPTGLFRIAQDLAVADLAYFHLRSSGAAKAVRASLRPSMPQPIQGISRIHARCASSRGGLLRVDEVARRGGLRPWIAQARYERSCCSVSMIGQGIWQRASGGLAG